VMGVLAHELGHLHGRHLTRRIVQSSAVAAASWLVFGDASSVMTALPTLVLDMKYSRDAESEADDYAVAMLRHNGIDPAHLAHAFARLEEPAERPAEHEAGQDSTNGVASSPYLSSHPSSAARRARILAAPRRAE